MGHILVRNEEATGSIPGSAPPNIASTFNSIEDVACLCLPFQEIKDMANPVPQTYANHVRWDPLFHFFALPVILLTVIAAAVHCAQRPSWFSAWLVVFSVAVVILTLKARLYALKAQDRLIRLEERERLFSLLTDPLRGRIGELSESQLIGLRFACDAEIPTLVEESITKKMSQGDIKKAIKVWRADYFRV
jgi:hypothetical protein